MKKIKILSFASLPLAMALLAGCGHEHTFSNEWTTNAEKHWHDATCEHKDQRKDEGPHVDDDHNGKCDVCDYEMPAPVSYEVTADEWVAAFGLKKPFYIADNYKLVATMSTEGQSQNAELIVDGLKLQANEKEGDVVETTYNEISGDKKYEYEYNSETKKWSKKDVRETIADDFAQYLQPYGENYSSFAYNAESKSYKCSSITYKGQAFTNLEIKFENKQIKEAKFDSAQEGHPMSMVFAFTYGGQVVTLPAVEDPQPGAPVYGYKFNDLDYVRMNYEDKNNQWSTEDMPLFAGDKLTFANISSSLQEPAVLTTLYCDGETHGFVISEGVLTAGEDGFYSFIISPEENKDRITIMKQESPQPESDCRLMGSFDGWSEGYPMTLKEGTTEYVVENVTVESAQSIKVKFGDDYIDEFKTTGGENNAFVAGVCKVESGDAFFNLNAVVNVYFESNLEGNYGVFIELKNVISPYKGEAFVDGKSVGELTFEFNKVDSSYYEYALLNAPAGPGIEYELQFSNGSPINVRTVEEGGEGENFAIVGTRLVYSGTKTALDFYLKDYGADYDVYVEEHVEPVTYNTLYLNPGDWINDGATFYAYFFDSTGTNTAIWVALTSEDGLYKVDKVEGYDKVIFVRCDPAKDPLVDGWDAKWNQTDDLDVPTDANVKCSITGWGEPQGTSPCTWGTK